MRSEDVIHSMFIPAFRVKRDVVPGRYAALWFNATRTGAFPLTCAEYCGTSHSDMKGTVFVHPAKPTGKEDGDLKLTYDEWLKNADPYGKLTPEQYTIYKKDGVEGLQSLAEKDPVLKALLPKLLSPADRGKQLADKKGCKSCHSIDGVVGQGPSWKGVYGKDEALTNGSKVKVDENYLRESILEPNAKIVAGFASRAYYPGYSVNFFDGQHFVLKGASARTARRLARPSFRRAPNGAPSPVWPARRSCCGWSRSTCGTTSQIGPRVAPSSCVSCARASPM